MYSHCRATITTIHFQNFFIIPKRSSASTQPAPHFPCPQPLVTAHRPSVSMNLPILGFHISRILTGFVLCVWLISLSVMFSRSIHIVACVKCFKPGWGEGIACIPDSAPFQVCLLQAGIQSILANSFPIRYLGKYCRVRFLCAGEETWLFSNFFMILIQWPQIFCLSRNGIKASFSNCVSTVESFIYLKKKAEFIFNTHMKVRKILREHFGKGKSQLLVSGGSMAHLYEDILCKPVQCYRFMTQKTLCFVNVKIK